MDPFVEGVIAEHRVQALLAPIQGHDRRPKRSADSSPQRNAPRKKSKKNSNQVTWGKTGKGKGRGEVTRSAVQMPQELRGMESSFKGKRI